jgi:hypothetical protein
MNRFNKSLAATFLSAAMLLPGVAPTMQIEQFDKMANDDQAEYVGELIQGAEKVLQTGFGCASQPSFYNECAGWQYFNWHEPVYADFGEGTRY